MEVRLLPCPGQVPSFPTVCGAQEKGMGPCPPLACTPGARAASQHLWLIVGAQLVEALLVVLGGLAWTDVGQQVPSLLLGMAFEGSHVFVPLDSTSPTQSFRSSDIPV